MDKTELYNQMTHIAQLLKGNGGRVSLFGEDKWK